MARDFEINEFVVVDFDWKLFKKNHKLIIATITGIETREIKKDGIVLKPKVFTATTLKYSELYKYDPINLEHIFCSVDEFKNIIANLEKKVRYDDEDLELLKNMGYILLM